MTDSGAKARPGQGIRLTLRDMQILETLLTATYLTTTQIMKLFWRDTRGGEWGRVKACQQRLKRLCEYGLIRRIEQPVTRAEKPRPYVYALDRKGAELLITELGVNPDEVAWKPRAQEANFPFLEHLLTTTEFRISLLEACKQTGVVLEDWIDEKELKSVHNVDYVTIVGPNGGQVKAAVVPDGYFKLCHQGRRGIFFLEVDMGTVTIAPSTWERRSWMRKVRAYVEYFKSQEYRTRYEGRRARVLTITPSPVRLEHLRQATERVFDERRRAGDDVSDQGLFWFAQFDEHAPAATLLADPLWIAAGSQKPQALIPGS